MKRTIKFLGILFLGTFALTSCSNQDCKKEMEALKNENDSLKLLINSNTLDARTYLNEFSEKLKNEKTKSIDVTLSKPITRDEAKVFTDSFRNATTLDIPLAWEFEKSHIAGLVNNANIAGVRFYACVNNNTNKFSLIAVSVDNNGDDIIGAAGEANSLMFEFAAPCPEKCPKPNDILMIRGAENIKYEFTRNSNLAQSRKSKK